ncbi:MAG: mechanosensitive ion channel family protein, partial [Pararhizobium sp.]
VNGNGVRNDLRLAIYERFREEGLGAPFPRDELEPEEPMPELAADAPAQQTEPADAVEQLVVEEPVRRSGTQRRPRRVSVEAVGDKD